MEAVSSNNSVMQQADGEPSAALSRDTFARLAIIVTLLMVVRLLGLKLSEVGLFYDEAQYWSWAQDLSPGYPTKPPLLAWLLFGVQNVCGDTEWCLRAPAPVLYAA